MKKDRKYSRSNFWSGLLVIIIGFGLLAHTLGCISQSMLGVLFSWQMLIIVVGFFSLANRNITFGFFTILTGVFFILPKCKYRFPYLYEWVPENFIYDYWPILVILLGILILFKRNSKIYTQKNFTPPAMETPKDSGEETNASGVEMLHKEANFTHVKYTAVGGTFWGGYLDCNFGGMDIDLRKATLNAGTTTLTVGVAFGGINLYIPAHWNVYIDVDHTFGGINDKRISTETVIDMQRTLVIKGSCNFGGLTIYS